MSADSLEPAYLLHRRRYRNSSLLLELLLRDHGRVPAVARGALGPRGGRATLLQGLQPLLVGLAGRGEVRTLTTAEAAGAAVALAGERLYCALYLNELLIRLLGRADPHPVLFERYHETLHRLAVADPFELPLRHFELDLLTELGYRPQLEREADGSTPVVAGRDYDYLAERGPVAAAGGDARGRVRGATLLALAARAPLDPRQAREARVLLRRILGHYLGPRPLKSRELFTHAAGARTDPTDERRER